MIFVDSNIPMYLVGADHPHKGASRSLLERAIADGEVLVTDADVLQEILHRYVAIDLLDADEVEVIAPRALRIELRGVGSPSRVQPLSAAAPEVRWASACSAFSSSCGTGFRSKTTFFTVPLKAYGALSR